MHAGIRYQVMLELDTKPYLCSLGTFGKIWTQRPAVATSMADLRHAATARIFSGCGALQRLTVSIGQVGDGTSTY